RQIAAEAGDADLRAVPVLACHVDGAARIVAYENGGQAGNDATGGQLRYPLGELGADGGGRGLAIKDDRGHWLIVPVRRSACDSGRGAVAGPRWSGCAGLVRWSGC